MLVIFIVSPLATTRCFGCGMVETACVCIDAESEAVPAHGCEDCDLIDACRCEAEEEDEVRVCETCSGHGLVAHGGWGEYDIDCRDCDGEGVH